MGPTLLIVCSIIIATIIVLLGEKSIHRSVTDPPPPSSPRYSPNFRNQKKNRNSDRFFLDDDWSDETLFDEPKWSKKRSGGHDESSRIIATLIFMAALIGLLMFLSV